MENMEAEMSSDCIEHRLSSRYRFDKHLGSGAYAQVGLFKDTTNWDSPVAIKVLHSHIALDDGSRERFHREGKIASSIRHPNVVSVIDSGVTTNGTPYLVMEFVEGKTLKALYEKRVPFNLSEKIALMVGIAQGLRAAHELKLTHRDIKPDNVLVTEDMVPRITDFGVAKPWDSDLRLTLTGDTVGTPVYMSPEQFQGEKVDARTDIYTYGAVCYELLTGTIPYHATNYQDMAGLHLSAPVPSVTKHATNLPDWIDEFIQLCMQKEPRLRFQNMDEIISVLSRDRRSFFNRIFG